MVYQTAGGTATAITLTMQTLVNGYFKTFIASVNNSGAATTINGKKLYKPGTTTAPNLIAGKAYTVWYNQAGDCFFIKASAEGDADVSNVLATKKFSNDNDTGLVGTMPNNGQVIIMPGTTNKVINKGFHDGTGYVSGDADLISGNIKAGINIFGVDGKSSVVDTADAIAGVSDIISGKTAYVNGNKITGQATIQSLGGHLYASGTATVSTDKKSFNGFAYNSGVTSSGNFYYIAVSGLAFTPSLVIISSSVSSHSQLIIYNNINTVNMIGNCISTQVGLNWSSADYFSINTVLNGFIIPTKNTLDSGGYSVNWIAFS
ncbi:MAG: putative phage tail fiber protein [Clostridiaceae bacterium]|jgi:hypothetical protein|nr:putative phage tail fiber protein [Clostridiaceae bacterium]